MNKWNPIHEVNRFFDDVFEHWPTRFGFDLAVDLYEEGDNLVAEMAVPAIDIDKTEVTVVDDVLKICGHREEKNETKEKNFYSKEIHRGGFERSLRLPASVENEQTKASYKDGILKVIMPLKKVSVEHKKIAINRD